MVADLGCFEELEEKDERLKINQWMTYTGDFTTALATPGLLTIFGTFCHHLLLFIINDDFHMQGMGVNKILQSKNILQACLEPHCDSK